MITEKELKHYEQIIAATPPIQPLLGRVLLVQIREEVELAERMEIPGLVGRDVIKKGELYIPAESKESIRENEVVKAVIKGVGPTRDGRKPVVKVGDIVYVFPNTFETIIKLNGLDWFLYGESDIPAIIMPAPESDIHCTKGMD